MWVHKRQTGVLMIGGSIHLLVGLFGGRSSPRGSSAPSPQGTWATPRDSLGCHDRQVDAAGSQWVEARDALGTAPRQRIIQPQRH